MYNTISRCSKKMNDNINAWPDFEGANQKAEDVFQKIIMC